MSNPNPLSPSGQKGAAPAKSNMRVTIIVIVALHAVLFCGVLLNACKPKEEKKVEVHLPPVLPPPTNDVTLPLPPSVPGTGITSTVLPGIVPPPTGLTNEVPVPPSTSTREHVVTKGDNFSTIAKKYSIGVNSIAKANPGVDSSRLKIGQKLSIPAAEAGTPKTVKGNENGAAADAYVVKSGDTLGRIAREHKTTVKSLRDANRLKTDAIKVGQKLKLPAATIAPSTGTKSPAPIPLVPPGDVPPLPPIK